MALLTLQVAGLWHSSLPQALLWYVPEREAAGKAMFAPSWSWAAVEGLVRPRKQMNDVGVVFAECHVIDVNGKLAGAFGAVTGVTIKLDGMLTPVKLVAAGEEFTLLGDDPDVKPEMHVWLDQDVPVETACFILPICRHAERDGYARSRIEALLVAKFVGPTFSRLGVVFIEDGWPHLIDRDKEVVNLI